MTTDVLMEANSLCEFIRSRQDWRENSLFVNWWWFPDEDSPPGHHVCFELRNVLTDYGYTSRMRFASRADVNAGRADCVVCYRKFDVDGGNLTLDERGKPHGAPTCSDDCKQRLAETLGDEVVR